MRTFEFDVPPGVKDGWFCQKANAGLVAEAGNALVLGETSDE